MQVRVNYRRDSLDGGILPDNAALFVQPAINISRRVLCERLVHVNPGLYRQVRALLDLNKAERHIRGGLATRRKYKGLRADA